MNKRVKELRKVLNLSQKEFADKLQITQAGLSKIEVGGSILTERNIKTICEKFNINEDWLRNGIEPIFNNDYSSMDINQRIKFFRTEISKNNKGKNYSQRQFAEKLGVSHGVINNIESNLVEAKDHIIKLICQTFNVNEDWLRNGNEPIFNEEEENLIKSLKNKYQLDEVSTSLLTTFVNLDDFSKKNIVDFLLKSIEDYYINNPDKLKELNSKINTFEEMCITKDEDIKNIQLYEIPASAGTGMLITDDIPYEIKQIDLTIAPQARKADFALYVRGDSMEPAYYDGDIVFIKEQPSIDNGQIGIFIYDDEAYIKKYSIQEDGTYLVSLNKKYKPIKIEENINCKVCGLVL